jgi:large subunit ribosomal protein L2
MKSYAPRTASRRHMTTVSYKDTLTVDKPHKSLTSGFRRGSGRNAFGRITTRHKGGGHKRKYREIDFKYTKFDIPAKIETLEYDPNRSGFIGVAVYADGERRYVLVPRTLKVGDSFIVSENASIEVGNRLPLEKIPVGTFVFNVELKPREGSKLVRSAGSYAEVIARDGNHVNIKLPSSEIRRIHASCMATVGEVSNPEHKLRVIGKAGRNRWLGKRPTVRGTAMNPVDHPMGGGEGRSRGQRKHRKNPWGKRIDPGTKTRKPKKYSNTGIISRRKTKRYK